MTNVWHKCKVRQVSLVISLVIYDLIWIYLIISKANLIGGNDYDYICGNLLIMLTIIWK
jgi:hypothetical protein